MGDWECDAPAPYSEPNGEIRMMKCLVVSLAITLGVLNTGAQAQFCPGTFVANGD